MHIEYVCVYVCLCTHTYVCIYAHILTHVDAYTFLSNISFKYCFLVISFIIQWQKPLALLGSWAERLSSKRCGPDVLASSASQELARAERFRSASAFESRIGSRNHRGKKGFCRQRFSRVSGSVFRSSDLFIFWNVTKGRETNYKLSGIWQRNKTSYFWK